MSDEYFKQQAARVATQRAACRIAAQALTDWLARYCEGEGKNTPAEVRVELERMRDAMLAAGTVDDALTPAPEVPS